MLGYILGSTIQTIHSFQVVEDKGHVGRGGRKEG